jgi:hypothetical protein
MEASQVLLFIFLSCFPPTSPITAEAAACPRHYTATILGRMGGGIDGRMGIVSRVRELAFHMESSRFKIASMAPLPCAGAHQSKSPNSVTIIATLQYGPLFVVSLDSLCVLLFSLSHLWIDDLRSPSPLACLRFHWTLWPTGNWSL